MRISDVMLGHWRWLYLCCRDKATHKGGRAQSCVAGKALTAMPHSLGVLQGMRL